MSNKIRFPGAALQTKAYEEAEPEGEEDAEPEGEEEAEPEGEQTDPETDQDRAEDLDSDEFGDEGSQGNAKMNSACCRKNNKYLRVIDSIFLNL